MNLEIRQEGSAISHLGLEAALPIYLAAKEERGLPSSGFYAAPILGFILGWWL